MVTTAEPHNILRRVVAGTAILMVSLCGWFATAFTGAESI
jgi:hypothetical protein